MTTSNPEKFDVDEFPKPIQMNGRFVIPWTNDQRPSFYEAFKTFAFGETKNGSNIPSQEVGIVSVCVKYFCSSKSLFFNIILVCLISSCR